MPKLAYLTLVVTVLVAVEALAWQASNSSAAPILLKRGYLAGLAADSAPAPAIPTSVPPPLQTELVVRIDVAINEPALSPGGTVVVDLRGGIEGTQPSGPPLTYLGGLTVSPHQTDVCQWNPIMVTTALEVSASRQTSLLPPKQEVVFRITSDPSWHYDVVCPSDPPVHITFPHAPVQESLGGWLGLIFPGQVGVNGVVVETPVYDGTPSCLHNRGVLRGTNTFGTATITVDILTPPCSPPPAAP